MIFLSSRILHRIYGAEMKDTATTTTLAFRYSWRAKLQNMDIFNSFTLSHKTIFDSASNYQRYKPALSWILSSPLLLPVFFVK